MAEIAAFDGVLRRTLVAPSGEKRYYCFGTIPSDKVKALTFVPVLEPTPDGRTYLAERTEAGYQRHASRTRMDAFADFLHSHPLSVVPPVVLSGRGNWEFQGDGPVGRLLVRDAAVIVDGQHRIGGYVRLYEKHGQVRPVDFILLPDLTPQQEKEEFLTINTTQIGVKKALTAYLEGTDEAMVAWALNIREDSPFLGRITRQRMERHHLFALHSVAKNVGRTFSHGALAEANLDLDQKVDIMVQYWTIIADCHPLEWAEIKKDKRGDFEYKLLELTGFIAWSYAASDILGPAFDPDYRAMNWELVETKIRRLADSGCLDWRKTGEFEGLTGEVGGKRIHVKMQWCFQKLADEQAAPSDE